MLCHITLPSGKINNWGQPSAYVSLFLTILLILSFLELEVDLEI